MWTIHYNDITVSYDNEEIYTDSPSLEAFILQAIQNPPTLYATPTGPAEVFNLQVAHLAYYLVANILVQKLDIRNWQATGDYHWPFDHETTGAKTTFSSQTENITTQRPTNNNYVEYLRNQRLGGESN